MPCLEFTFYILLPQHCDALPAPRCMLPFWLRFAFTTRLCVRYVFVYFTFLRYVIYILRLRICLHCCLPLHARRYLIASFTFPHTHTTHAPPPPPRRYLRCCPHRGSIHLARVRTAASCRDITITGAMPPPACCYSALLILPTCASACRLLIMYFEKRGTRTLQRNALYPYLYGRVKQTYHASAFWRILIVVLPRVSCLRSDFG